MQVLLRIRDKINNDSILLDAKCTKKGDVIVSVPDDHIWGSAALTNPDWRIIKAPSLTSNETDTFVVSEPEVDPFNPNPLKQARAFMFDFSSPLLPQEFINFINDDSRQVPIYESPWDAQTILSLKILRPTRQGEL